MEAMLYLLYTILIDYRQILVRGNNCFWNHCYRNRGIKYFFYKKCGRNNCEYPGRRKKKHINMKIRAFNYFQ